MANLSITRRCRRRCSFCFARHELSRGSSMDMEPEVFDAALGWLQRSGFPEARLLGGEPTEHPRFPEYVSLALERGFRVVVFSGGLIPRRALEFLADLPTNAVSVVLNAADPGIDGAAVLSEVRDACRTLGDKAILGVTVRTAEQDLGFVVDWISAHGLRRTIRVGVAHPIWGAANEFFRMRVPGGRPILEHVYRSAAKAGIDVSFDCGLTPCMFSDRFIDAHPDLFMPHSGAAGLVAPRTDELEGRDSPVAIGVCCEPVVDVLPEGECIACYALSRFRRVPLPRQDNRGELVSWFEAELRSVLPVGMYRECASCGYRTAGMCSGGCRARQAMRMRPDPLAPLRPTGGRHNRTGDRQ